MTYPYNADSVEGRRMMRLLSAQNSPSASLVATSPVREKTRYIVEAGAQCKANQVEFQFQSNLSGIKRPYVRVDGEVQVAWGNFADDVRQLDFRDGEVLPVTYVQPLDDAVHKQLIDGGLYDDPNFESLFNQLVEGDYFDIISPMTVTCLHAHDEQLGELPVVFIEPVHVTTDSVSTPDVTVTNLLARAATVAAEFRGEGVSGADVLAGLAAEPSVFVPPVEAPQYEPGEAVAAESAYLGESVDVTDIVTPILTPEPEAVDVLPEAYRAPRVAPETSEPELEL